MSICLKCKFLIICDASHKDSIIECEDFENNQKTNADRIRAMSDEKLMTWIMEMQACPYELYQDCQNQNYDCKTCIKDWLKQEAEI